MRELLDKVGKMIQAELWRTRPQTPAKLGQRRKDRRVLPLVCNMLIAKLLYIQLDWQLHVSWDLQWVWGPVKANKAGARI